MKLLDGNYECYMSDTKTERITQAPQVFLTIDEVAIFIRRFFGSVTTNLLVRSICTFADGRSEQFTYTQGNQTLVVRFHYI